MPGLGHKSYIQIAKQSAYDTFVAPLNNSTTNNRGVRLELINWRVDPVIGVIRDPSILNRQSRRGIYQGGRAVRGTFSVRANYEGLEELLRSAFGSYTGTVVSGNIVDHNFYEGATLTPISIEAVVGDIPTGKSFNITGAKMTALTIRGTAGTGNDAMLVIDFTLLGKQMTSNNTVTPQTTVTSANVVTSSGTTITRSSGNFTTDGFVAGMVLSGTGITDGATVITPGTTSMTISAKGTDTASFTLTGVGPSTPGVYPILYHQAVSASVKDGSGDATTDIRIRSFEVTLESPHTEERFYLSSLDMDEPLRQDFINVRWRLTQEFNTKTQYDAARNFTEGSLQLLFRHPTDITGSSHFREFELRSNRAYVTEFSAPVDGYGVIISNVTWEAIYNTTDSTALFARTRNARAVLA